MAEHNNQQNKTESRLALVIGNTRLHWGYFYQGNLLDTWHTPHLTQASLRQFQQARFQTDDRELIPPSEVWIASVVPDQLSLWLPSTTKERTTTVDESAVDEPNVYVIDRSRISLNNLYPTLGIDRAINLLGAGQISGWPTLVIDSGTALTFTAGSEETGNPSIHGGAILPGLRLQYESLAQKTAALGAHMPEAPAPALPKRWATDTAGAIASGVTYSFIATVVDYLASWWQQFPHGKALLTGGDAPLLHHYLQQKTPEVASRVLINSELMFYGMQVYRNELMLF